MTAPHTAIVELYLNGAWVNITADVRQDPGISIDFGLKGESGLADPSQATLVVNNTTGKYTPKNPVGPYYGYLKRNTPLRVTVDTVVRYVGEVSEFPSRWEPSGGEVWEPLIASGVLRRLLRSQNLASTLFTYFTNTANVVGYWPMTDPDGSTSFGSAVTAASPMAITAGAPDFAAYDPGPASEPIATWAGAQANGFINTVPGSTGFTVAALVSIPVTETANGATLLWVATAGAAANIANLWTIEYRVGGYLRLRAYNNGAQVLDSGDLNHLMIGATRYVVLEVEDVGADVKWYLSTDIGTSIATLTGYQTSSPTLVSVGSPQVTGAVAVGQVAAASVPFAFYSTSFDQAKAAYAGESVEARIARIATLAGVTMTVTADATVSALLGPQPFGSMLEVMRDGEQADIGLLRDALNGMNALSYTTRRAMYNLTAALTLNYASGHLSPPLEPTDDDALLVNDVTATRPEGSSARSVDQSSALSALPYPAGVGPYQLDYPANVYTDAQLPYVASWLMYRGTQDLTRYPQVTIDLTRNPSLAAAFDALRPGGLVDITNLPVYAGADSARVHAMGWTEYVTPYRRVVTLNCRPAAVEDVVRLNDTRYGRLDSSTTTTNEPLDATETGVDYIGDTWITTASHPAEFPFDIVIGGEEMRVTAATGVTFTVTRSLNGVVKTHLTGVPIRLADPNRLAL